LNHSEHFNTVTPAKQSVNMEYEKAKQLFINRWPFRAYPASINIDTGSEILHCQNLAIDGTCELTGIDYTPIEGTRMQLLKEKMVTEILNKEKDKDSFSGATEWFLDKDDYIINSGDDRIT